MRHANVTTATTAATALLALTLGLALPLILTLRSGSAQAADPAAPQVIASGLQAPWSITFHGAVPLVSERGTARILALDADGGSHLVATIAGVDGRGEGGLLGITVHAGYLYAYFTAGTQNRIARYRLSGSGTRLALGPAEKVLDGIPSASYHNGGRIAFGPDGMLYASTGDAGTPRHAQNLKSLAGKILRMTAEGKVPRDNPFTGSYVYSYGHRNVQGLAWAADGSLYASEFGENTWDELNRIRAGGNYGWPDVEGKATEKKKEQEKEQEKEHKDNAHKDKFIDPLQQWPTAQASPSGMAFKDGFLYLASLRGQRLRKIPVAAPHSAEESYVRQYGRLRDVVVTPSGQLWVLTNNTDGRGQPQPGDDRILALP